MDAINKKKTKVVSGSDIDEEVEECLEDLEDIANEIIASSSDSECEPVCNEVHEEIQKYSKGNSKVKEKDIMASQTENESHKIVNNELVQSIKKYIQEFVKGKSETSEMRVTCVEKNTEENVNNLRNSSLVHSSDGEQKSDESMSNRNTENKCEIIEGTEIISDNSDWENLESGECSSSEEELHKLYDDDMDYLSDATTVTGEDKSQIKKSVQEYYKKSEECFVSFYNKIKQGLTDDRINIDDCNSFKSKTHSNSDSGTKRMCKVTCHSDYNRAKLILQEFKRKSGLYKKSHRQSDTEHSKAKGHSTVLGIVSQLDSHVNQELCSRLSANLKKRLEKLKKNVKKYEKKVGLKKREHSKKNNILVKEAGRITNDNMELSCENLDGRESMYSQDKTEKSKNKHLESHHNRHNHSKKRIGSIAIPVSRKRSSKEKMKVSEKVNDKSSSWENSTIKKLTILSYLEDCENSVGDNKRVHKERKSESNIFKKQHENFEYKEKKTSAVSGPNKQSGKPLDKKKVDPDYDNGELFITYSQLIKNENKNCNEGSEEEKCSETKDVSVFALTLSSEYGKHSSAIPFLQDETDECNAKKQSKELNDTHEVNYIIRECGLKSKLNSESHRTSSEKTKHRQSKVSNTLSPTVESHLVRSVSTSPLRTSSRSRSNSQSRITIERERYSRRSKSRSNSLNRPIVEKERPPRRSRSRSSSIILEKETFSKSSKTTPNAYRKKRSRSRSRSRYYKRYRSPSPHYRKRYRSRSRSLRRKRSSDRSRRSKRKYSTSSSEERAVKPRSRTPSRSLAARTPTRSFGDELRRKLKEENEKALALLKLTLAAQDKGQVTSSKLVPFTSSSEEQRKDVTYKQVTSETSEVSSSSKTESTLSVHTQIAHTPPLIPLPPLPPSEPQPAPPLPANANDVTVVTTYTSYVPMCGPSQPPQNYIHPPHTNDMYMPYINPEMHHHHHPYMYPPPGMNSYQMGSEGVPPMFQQPPPPHMMTHPPPNSYGPPFPYMHNVYPVPMQPYQNAPYQGPVMPPNFTCQQNIVTMSSEPPGKKTASSGPILMEIGSDSENSVHSPVLPQNPTIQEAIQFVKQKMLKDDIKKAINENKSGTDSVQNQGTENTDDVINTENVPNNSEENKHESDECDGLKADNVHDVCSKNKSIKFKPIKFTLQSKARPVVPMNNSDVFGNSDNDCENIPVPKLNSKRTSKEQASEQTSSENGIGTNKVTIERSPVIYSNVLYRSPVKNSGPSKNISGNIPKTKNKQTESETKSSLKIVEIEETGISNKNKDTQLQKKDVKNDSHKKSNESELNNVDKLIDTKKSAEVIEINNYSNIHKTGSTENNYNHTVSKQEEKQNLEGNASEELIVQHVEAVKKSKKKQVIASDAELQEPDANSKTASRNETEFLDKEESVESQKHSSIIKTADTNKTEFLINEKQTELQEPHDHRKATNEMNFVVNEKSTELEKSDTEDKATSKNESKFINNENSSKLQVHVCKTSDRNETDSSVGKTNIELQESVVKNKTAIENETEDLYTTQGEEHVNETFNKNHCNKTHNNVVGNKEKIVCELESVVSTDKGAQEKLKVKVTGNDGNKCSDYTNISVEATLKEEKEIKRYGLNVLPDKQCTEVYEKGEYTENGAHAEYVTQEKNNFSTNESNESKNRANTPVSMLLNEESNVLEKTEIETEASNIHRIGTICDKSEVSEDVKGSAEKEVVSNSDIQGSENKQTITDVSICEDRDESKLCSEFTFKENNKTKDAYLHPCELESDRMLLQSDNLLNHKINTKHNLRNKKYNKKQSSPNYMYKKNDKIEDSKVNDNQNLVSGNKTYTNNDTEENNEVRDVPVQKETVKLALVSESDIIIQNQGRKLTDVSKTESDGRSITAAVQSQQADINKVIYKPCPLSKKTPRELTMMFLNDDSDTSTYGIKLKDLRINLVRVKIPPLSSPDCKIHTTSQGNNLVTEMSSGGAPQKKKTGRKRRINSQNDESLVQQVVECVEDKDESSNSLIRSDKLSESTSRLCENYKKILEILKSFESNRLTVEQNKRKRVVMKTVLNENTIDIVPLSNCYTNVLSKFDKLNAIQGHNKEPDYAQKEEWVNKNNSIALDHKTGSDRKSLLQTTEEKLPTLLGSLVSDSHLKDISINCKTQKNKCFEHAEDTSDSSKVMKIKSLHSELMKECNSETEDSLLGEFASNDSNASLTCEQDSSNSLILKINRGRKKKGTKRNIKLCSSTENNDISSTNIDEKNVNENTTSSTFSNEEKISFPRITDSHDISNNTMQADENLNNRGDHLTESAVFDFKDESSRDTALEETYLLFKRRKSLNKKKFKIKKRKITTDDKSDDLVIQPKILRSQSHRSKSSTLEETDVLSPFVTSKETSNTETEISRTSVTDNIPTTTALYEVNTICPDESQMVTCKVPVLVSAETKENTENSTNLLASENVKCTDSSRLWEKISHCLNTKCRNVTTQVRFRQFTLHGEVTVEDTHIVSSETGMLSLSDVISALTKLHSTSA